MRNRVLSVRTTQISRIRIHLIDTRSSDALPFESKLVGGASNRRRRVNGWPYFLDNPYAHLHEDFLVP